MWFRWDLCLGKQRRSTACRHACPHPCLYFCGGGLQGEGLYVAFPSTSIWHLFTEVLISLKRVVLLGSLSNKGNCFKALYGPILFFWILFNICFDPIWKVLIFQLEFLLYFQARLSLGLGMENRSNYVLFFPDAHILMTWKYNSEFWISTQRETRLCPPR